MKKSGSKRKLPDYKSNEMPFVQVPKADFIDPSRECG